MSNKKQRLKVGSFYLDSMGLMFLVMTQLNKSNDYVIWHISQNNDYCMGDEGDCYVYESDEIDEYIPVEIEPHEIQRFIKWT